MPSALKLHRVNVLLSDCEWEKGYEEEGDEIFYVVSTVNITYIHKARLGEAATDYS